MDYNDGGGGSSTGGSAAVGGGEVTSQSGGGFGGHGGPLTIADLKFNVKLNDLKDLMQKKGHEALEQINRDFGGLEGLARRLDTSLTSGIDDKPEKIAQRVSLYGRNDIPPKKVLLITFNPTNEDIFGFLLFKMSQKCLFYLYICTHLDNVIIKVRLFTLPNLSPRFSFFSCLRCDFVGRKMEIIIFLILDTLCFNFTIIRH